MNAPLALIFAIVATPIQLSSCGYYSRAATTNLPSSLSKGGNNLGIQYPHNVIIRRQRKEVLFGGGGNMNNYVRKVVGSTPFN